MAVRDDAEKPLIKKAAKLTTRAMSWAVEQVEGIVNDETKVMHSKLSEQLEDKILAPAELGIKDIDSDDVDTLLPSHRPVRR